MEQITRFMAKDEKIFNTAEEALKHEAMPEIADKLAQSEIWIAQPRYLEVAAWFLDNYTLIPKDI